MVKNGMIHSTIYIYILTRDVIYLHIFLRPIKTLYTYIVLACHDAGNTLSECQVQQYCLYPTMKDLSMAVPMPML